VLRAGPFSDERVIRLANRRFISFYFDLSNRGHAGDPDARKFVVAVQPRLGGRSVPTPPVLFMSPQGKLLGQVSNYASSDQVLAAMLKVLAQHPEFNKPSKAEQEVETALERAEIQLDLQQRAAARKILAGSKDAASRYLLGRIARFEQQWKLMESHFKRLRTPELADDIRMERAYRLWQQKRYAELNKALTDFPKQSNRYSESRYYLGLSLFLQKKPKEARVIWQSTIKACAQDRWIYRADWAYTNSLSSGRPRAFSSRGRSNSCLNRIGYMGRRNPDLRGPAPARK